MSDLHGAVEALRALPPWTVYAVVFGAGFGEYVFPPLPGDTIVVAAVVLVAVFGWSLPATFAVLVTSNLAGALVTYAIGARLRGRLDALAPPRRRAVTAVLDLIERRGLVVIVLNRFFPAIRGVFFVAAGAAGLPLGRVLGLAGIGGALWGALLLALGAVAGSNLAWLEGVVRQIGFALGAAAVGLVVAVVLAVRRSLAQGDK